jgi:hypothetical protein
VLHCLVPSGALRIRLSHPVTPGDQLRDGLGINVGFGVRPPPLVFLLLLLLLPQVFPGARIGHVVLPLLAHALLQHICILLLLLHRRHLPLHQLHVLPQPLHVRLKLPLPRQRVILAGHRARELSLQPLRTGGVSLALLSGAEQQLLQLKMVLLLLHAGRPRGCGARRGRPLLATATTLLLQLLLLLLLQAAALL